MSGPLRNRATLSPVFEIAAKSLAFDLDSVDYLDSNFGVPRSGGRFATARLAGLPG